MVHGSSLTIMTIVELSVNIAISVAAGAASGYGIFKFLGKNWDLIIQKLN